MLVLSRMVNEKIEITVDGRKIGITVVDIKGQKVRLGFQADRDITILRDDVGEKKPAVVAQEEAPHAT